MICPLCEQEIEVSCGRDTLPHHIDNHADGSPFSWNCVCGDGFLHIESLREHLESFGDDLKAHLMLGVLGSM